MKPIRLIGLLAVLFNRLSCAAIKWFLHRAALALFALGLITPWTYAHAESDPFITPLIAGGGNVVSAIDAGDVLVWNDAENLYVKYLTAEGWCLTETHLHIAISLGDIPQKNGNPIPGQFDISRFLICAISDEIGIPLENFDLAPGDMIYVASHASLVENLPVEYSDGPLEETAWGDGEPFAGANWATYFTYTVPEATTSSGDEVWED